MEVWWQKWDGSLMAEVGWKVEGRSGMKVWCWKWLESWMESVVLEVG